MIIHSLEDERDYVPHTYLVSCVSFVGLVYGSCWRLIQLEILVDVVSV